MNLGDFAVGATIDLHFTTRQFSSGAPFTLAGTPVVSAYEDNGVTQITAGITLTADFDSVTGLNHVRVVASGANGFEAGKSYSLVITTGTVDSVSVVGEVVACFTLERGAAFGRLGAPAGASIAADIAAVKAETAAILVDTGTTLQNELDGIQADTEDIQSKIGTPADLGGGSATLAGNLADIEAQTDDIGAAGAGLTAVPWNAAWDAEVQSEVQDALETNNLDHLVGTATGIPALPAGTYLDQMLDDGTAAFDRTTDSLQAIRDHATTIKSETALIVADTNELQTDWADGGRLDLILDARASQASVDTIDDFLDTEVAAILEDTGTTIPGLIAALNDLSAADVNAQVLDVLNVDTFAEIGQETPAATQTIRKMLAFLYKAWRNRSTQTADTYALYNDDATTVAQKATFSDDGATADRGEMATGP